MDLRLGHAGARRIKQRLRLLLLGLIPLAALSGTSYVYDDLGRVIQATNSDGTATVYQYDANGNITSIKRQAASTLFISGVSPTSAHAGASLIITGSGFSATPTDNTVTIGDAAATVTSASLTSLTVTVPSGANTGLVTVTVGTSSAFSPRTVTILRPVISSFSPTLANVGMAVTLTGANLNLVPGSTSVSVGGVPATISQISNSSITFTAPASSGSIQLQTPYGNASSPGVLTTLPGNFNLNDVVATGAPVPGGSAVPLNLSQNSKYGVLSISLAQGAYASVQLSDYATTPANYSTDYEVRSPSNAVIASGSVSNWALSIHLPPAAVSGTYLVVFSSWRAPVQLKAAVEINPVVNGAGSLGGINATTSQSKRFIVSLTAGQSFAFGVKNLVTTPTSANSMTVSIYKPDGAQLWSRGCYASDPLSSCGLPFFNVAQTGNYVVYATPSSLAGMSFDAAVSQAIPGALTAGTPQPFTTTQPGQIALESFTATAGQTVTLHIGSIATTPANNNLYISVFDPSGNWVTDRSTTGDTVFNFTGLQAGTYHVLVVPWFGLTASGQVTLANGVTGSVPTNGTTSSFSTTVPGQNAYLTFDATAGDNIGIGLTNLATTPASVGGAVVSVYRPSGGLLTQRSCYTWDPLSSCGQQPFNFPESGTYKIVVSPSGMAKMNFNLTLSHAQTGTLTPGAAFAANSSVPGQFSLLDFSVAANQNLAINLASTSTAPPQNNVYIAILDANGNNLTNRTTTGGTTFNLALAPGNYRVFWVPYFALTGTAQITLVENSMQTLAVDGATSNYSTSVPGQVASYLIPETAGDEIGIGLTNLVTSGGSIDLSLYSPNGSWVWGRSCYVWDPLSSCTISFTDLAQTGNYKLVATPSAGATMNYNLTLSRPITATLTPGVPQTIAPPLHGQFAWLDFNGTSGHSATLTIDSIVTNPANVYTWASINNPSGGSLGYAGSPNPMTFNFNLSTGTHHVYWIPYYAVTGSARFTLTVN